MGEQIPQVSFIPKKPMVKNAPRFVRTHHTNPISFLALLIFLFHIGLAGFVYYRQQELVGTIKEMSEQLEVNRADIENSSLADIKLMDQRLRAAKTVLNKHISASTVFDFFEKNTLKNVQITDFDFSDEGGTTVEISGLARTYNALGKQAELLESNAAVTAVLFSDIGLTDTGNVEFSAQITFTPNFVRQMRVLEASTTTN